MCLSAEHGKLRILHSNRGLPIFFKYHTCRVWKFCRNPYCYSTYRFYLLCLYHQNAPKYSPFVNHTLQTPYLPTPCSAYCNILLICPFYPSSLLYSVFSSFILYLKSFFFLPVILSSILSFCFCFSHLFLPSSFPRVHYCAPNPVLPFPPSSQLLTSLLYCQLFNRVPLN